MYPSLFLSLPQHLVRVPKMVLILVYGTAPLTLMKFVARFAKEAGLVLLYCWKRWLMFLGRLLSPIRLRHLGCAAFVLV